MALCNQQDVEYTLQISFTVDPEPVITDLISRASQIIKDNLHREIEENSYTETFDGKAQTVIRLREWPVTVVTSITENGNLLTTPDEYLWYEDGRVARMAGEVESRWHKKRQGVVAVYTAGYNPVPDSIRGVTAQLVGRVFKMGAAFAATPSGVLGSVKSISLEGSDSIEYTDPPDEAKGIWELEQEEIMRISSYKRRLHL